MYVAAYAFEKGKSGLAAIQVAELPYFGHLDGRYEFLCHMRGLPNT